MIFVFVFAVSPLFAREKTDIVYFTNGDRIMCEIKKLQRGKLTVKSVGFSTIHIEWDKVAHLESTHPFQLELQSGTRYVGTLAPGPEDGKIEVETVTGTSRLDLARIVVITPAEEGFFQKLDGSLDIGYEFNQAVTSTSWSLSAETRYIAEAFEVTVNAESLFKTQEGAEDVNRQNIRASYIHVLQDRWFAAGLGSGEKNANQSLEFRGLVSGSIGRRLLQTNRTNVALLGGFALSREKFEDTDFVITSELVAGFLFDTFRFNTPEVQITTSTLLFVNAGDAGRIRLQANGKVRLELIKDFFWSVSLYESFDSNPPSEFARRNDFGLTTSFGWSF